MIASAGGAGGTDWASLSVPQMWAMLSSYDDSAHRRLIGGWRRSYELVQQHMSRVRAYRAGLAAAWPPGRSPAATAYFTRLDAMIANLEETYEAAVANHRAFTGASGALRQAREEMAGIHREHAANAALLTAYAEEKHLYQLTPGKARGVPPARPVADGRQAALEARARAVMSALSTELAQAQTALVVPAAYSVEHLPTGRSGSRPPLHARAPSVYAQPIPGSPAGPSVASPGSGLPPSAGLVRPTPGGTVRPTPGGTVGPTPGGTVRPTPEVAIRPPSGGAARPSPARSSSASAVRPSPSPSPSPSPVPAEPSRRTGVIAGGSAAPPAADQPASAAPNRPMPSGHVIGAPPEATASDGRSPRLVNPVGGVIGHVPPQAPPPAGRSAPPAHRRRRSSDEPWKTPAGVDPVIQPSPERPIDPGPVIGHT